VFKKLQYSTAGKYRLQFKQKDLTIEFNDEAGYFVINMPFLKMNGMVTNVFFVGRLGTESSNVYV
jgi:hypothetical protein